jgi:hypothetical protein
MNFFIDGLPSLRKTSPTRAPFSQLRACMTSPDNILFQIGTNPGRKAEYFVPCDNTGSCSASVARNTSALLGTMPRANVQPLYPVCL